MIATTFTAITMALSLGLASFGAAAAQEAGACLQGRQIQQAIDAGEILELADALNAAGVDEKPLSQPEVCDINGRLQYRVNIMNSYGEAERIVLNAQGN